eukprot:COSAG02_NODE_15627_length_1153_cov_3.137571_1_plen_31_part_00
MTRRLTAMVYAYSRLALLVGQREQAVGWQR